MTLTDRPAAVPMAMAMAGGGRPRRRSRRRRRGRRRVVRAVLVLGLLAVVFVAATFVEVFRSAGGDARPRSGAIVVLGAAQYDGRPSPALLARLEHGLDLYRDGVAPVIVLTGGRQTGDRYTEATTGYLWLRDRGVPDEALRREVEGTSTFESMSSVAGFLEREAIDEVVLVSDPSHSYRLQAVAREVGLVPHVSPAHTGGSSRGSARALGRETVAVSIGRLIGYRRLDRLDTNR